MPQPRYSAPSSRFDAVICDIDGCLGPESTAPLDAHDLARIADHNKAAIEQRDRPLLTLCSGRPLPYAEAICRLLHNSLLPCVCENGVWLFDPTNGGRCIMDPSITAAHLAGVDAARAWIASDLSPRGVMIQPGKSASISLWHPDTAYLMSLRDALRTRFDREQWPLRVSNTVAWINCDLDFISKQSGITRLIAETNLQRDRLAGIGDTISDMAIRRSVAWFACPSNADAALKQHADHVASSAESRGVLELLALLGAGSNITP